MTKLDGNASRAGTGPLLALILAAGGALPGCGGRHLDNQLDAGNVSARCGVTGEEVPYEGGAHLPEGTKITYRHNPPASGAHYPIWARYRIYDQPVPRSYWVHNLEHGAVVLLYRPDAPPDVVAQLKQAYAAIPDDPKCGHKRALLTPDPLLPTPVALVVANFVVARDRIDIPTVLTVVGRCRAMGLEDICFDGDYPP